MKWLKIIHSQNVIEKNSEKKNLVFGWKNTINRWMAGNKGLNDNNKNVWMKKRNEKFFLKIDFL